MSPTQPFGKALTDFVETLTDKKRKLTQEKVDSVLEDGRVVIRGNILPVTGRVPIIAGETVVVAWRDNKMELVMLNQGRRSGGAASDVQQVTGIVEELFLSGDDLQVWFRNADQFKPLVFVDDQGNGANAPIALNFQGGAPFWGLGDADFFVFSGTLVGGNRAVAVYRLNRPTKNEPFPAGHRVTAQLVNVYNLTTNATTFGTMSITGTDVGVTQTGTASGDLRYAAVYSLPSGAGPTDPPFLIRIESLVDAAYVAPNGELLVVIRVRAQTIETAQTNPTFEMGMLLVNVDRALVMANHVAGAMTATVYLSTSSIPVCTAIGTADVATSVGVSAAEAGTITVLSLTGADAANPSSPNQPGTFNNYLLRAPATVFNGGTVITTPPSVIFCGALPAASTLSVFGELADGNDAFATFPGNRGQTEAQIVRYQGSRTLIIFAAYGEGGTPTGPPTVRDLRARVSTPITGSAELIFRDGPPVPNAARPLIQMLQASLIYSPFDNRAPFNHQFFVAGHNSATGVVDINLAALRKLTALAEQAKLKAATSATQVSLVTSGGQSRQALDSQLNLGGRFQAGPL